MARGAPGPVIAIDGPSGSGKTALAADLAGAMRRRGVGVLVVHMDDLHAGWDGLEAAVDHLVDGVLGPFCRGEREIRMHRWDWTADRRGPVVTVPVPRHSPLLVVEGVGAGARAAAPFLSVLVWMQVPDDVRKQRALARDGEVFARNWDRWADAERRHFGRERTRERADLLWQTQVEVVP